MSTPNNMGFQGSDAPPQAPQPAPQQAPVSQATPAPKQGWGTRILGALSGGGKNTNYNVDPNGVMQAVQTPQAPGQMFKNLLGGMLTGLAAGSQSQTGLGGFSAGFQAQQARLQQQDQLKRAQAQQNFVNQQNAQKNQAEIADKGADVQYKNALALAQKQETVIKTLQAQAMGAQMTEHAAELLGHYNQFVKEHPDAKTVAEFNSPDDLWNSVHTHPDLMQQWMDGEITPVPVPGKDGSIKMDLVRASKNLAERPIGPGHYLPEVGPGKDGKPTINWGDEVASSTPRELYDKAYNSKVITEAFKDIVQTQKDQNTLQMQHLRDMEQDKRFAFALNMQDRHFSEMMQMAQAKGQIMSEGDKDEFSKGLAHYEVDLNTAKFTRAELIDLFARARKINPALSQMTYESARKAQDSLASGEDHKQLLAADKALQHNYDLRQIIQNMPNSGDVKVINQFLQGAARQFGNGELGDVDALKTALKEELAKSTKGGTPDITLEKNFNDLLNSANGHQYIMHALDRTAHITAQNVNSIAAQAAQNIPGFAGKTYRPNLSAGAQESLAARGIQNPLDYNQFPKPMPGDSTKAPDWVLQKAMQAAGGDVKKAHDILTSNSWN